MSKPLIIDTAAFASLIHEEKESTLSKVIDSPPLNKDRGDPVEPFIPHSLIESTEKIMCSLLDSSCSLSHNLKTGIAITVPRASKSELMIYANLLNSGDIRVKIEHSYTIGTIAMPAMLNIEKESLVTFRAKIEQLLLGRNNLTVEEQEGIESTISKSTA